MTEKMSVEQALSAVQAVLDELPWHEHEAEIALATLRAEIARLNERLADSKELNQKLVQRRCQADDALARLEKLSSRAYVSEQMRGLVPEKECEHDSAFDAGLKSLRRETLANIEKWEKESDEQ